LAAKCATSAENLEILLRFDQYFLNNIENIYKYGKTFAQTIANLFSANDL